ncbi:hypothetical protein T492DRAFT_884960 [Pavlovales sp. CCMP2436]|nr:hypothetical protein T492DRAFT_884960 [Pavlovales sp. CCMP2436]
MQALGVSDNAPASTLTLTERVHMLVNETRHLAQLTAKMGHAISVLYRKAAGLSELETLQFVTVSGSARATAAAASGAASFAAGQAGAQPTSALPPLRAHGASRKRDSRIQNEGEAPKKASGRGGGRGGVAAPAAGAAGRGRRGHGGS